MIPGRIQGATNMFGAPPDWDEARDGLCGVLPVLVEQTAAGGLSFSSAWLPTPEELAALNTGGSVLLKIYAPFHPVVAVGVLAPVEPIELDDA
jgi:hypothetical protein